MKKIISFAFIFLMLLSLTACDKAAVKEKTIRVPGEALELSGDEFVTVGESENMLLLVNPSTGALRWQEKATGTYLDTKLMDTGITNSAALTLKSDIVAKYFSGSESNKYEATSTMDTYTYGVEQSNMTYETIENGIRLVYTLGSDKVTYKEFPAYISQERMENLVLQYLDESQQKTVLKQYRLTMSGIYSRKTNEDNPLSGMAAPQLYELFYNVGHYTYEELEVDNTEYDKLDEMPSRANFDFTMDYYLDGDDLVVKIPTGELIENEEYPIRSLEFLPYFLSSSESEGYLFVPDGSGALINLDNNKSTEYRFTSRYYNGDLLIDAESYSSTKNVLTMPVYGIKTNDYAVLGIIESGAEIATLDTYISGFYSGIPYSRASLTFNIREEQLMGSYADALTNFKSYRVSSDFYTEDIQVRYCYLSGEAADYSGMAEVYTDYLVNNGTLTAKESEDQAPFFVELLGEVDKKKYFLGIPYHGKLALTTFLDAESILKQLSSEGVENIKLQYTGLANGGVNQRAVETVTVSDSLGGTKGLQSLVDYASQIGASIYPSFQLQTAVTSKGLSKEERSFFLSGKVAEIYQFTIVDQIANTSSDFPTYIIHPTYISDYISRFCKSYNKLGISNIASTDFYTFYSASYKKDENISMTSAKQYYEEALKKLSSEYSLMLSNPMIDAYSTLDYVTDLPTDNSGMKILDASVPFMQMVIDGYVEYSSTRLNVSSTDLHIDLMKAIETKSNLKFLFMTESKDQLTDTTLEDTFMTEYANWIGEVGPYYKEYNAFYQKVKDAAITEHSLWNGSGDTVIVKYSNGVSIYLNYTKDETVIDGVAVPAESYVIK